MKTGVMFLSALMLLTGCRNLEEKADAYGNFEVTEVIVSPETGGRLLKYEPVEGSEVREGDEMALIDSTLLILQRDEIDAGISSVRTRIAYIEAQNEILRQQIANIEINIRRIENMLKDDAATRKQYDDLTGQADVIRKQIAANNAQKASTAAEISVLEAKRHTVSEQISRCRILSPINGTLIEKYAEKGEISPAGRPLGKIADLSVLKLKVYVSGSQLPEIKIGQECTVRIDDGEKGYRSLNGRISYISEKAEFTPKIIQTKEERVTLVYAVNIDVVNDGSLKAGMPGEALFQ